MKETTNQKLSKSDLLANRDKKIASEVLEEGSKDLYDIIKFCCAIKENPQSPNLREWSRKELSSNLNSMVYENPIPENAEFDEQTNRVLSYAQRAQIYAMTAITALTSGDGEKAVWNFHVAPVVYVKSRRGKIEKYVIDPSLFSDKGFIKLSIGKKKHFKITN